MSTPSPSPAPAWPDRIAVGVLAVITAIAALTFRGYGLGWDDFTLAQYGDLLLALYTSGLRDTRALSFVNLYLYGGGFDMAAALLAKFSPFDLFETRRLAAAVVGLSGLAITWRIGRRIGGPLAGLCALLLLATCPLYYGHMFINPKDAPFAVAMALFLLGLVRALDQYPKPSIGTVVILGLGFGLAIGSRIMAGFGGLTALIALALLFGIEGGRDGWRAVAGRLGRFLIALVPAAAIAYAAMALVWPWGVADVLNPLRAVGYFAHFFEKPWQELFDGQLIEPPAMPRSYVPLLLGLKLPELFLLLGGGGAIGALVAAARPSLAPTQRATLTAVALAALLPVAAAVAMRPAMYNGVRHFVFILPPLAAAGGLAAGVLAVWLRPLGRVPITCAILLFLMGLALPAAAMVRLHPYEYVHFNFIAGGIRGAQARFMLDYWGLAFKQAAQALLANLAAYNEHPPDDRKWKIAVCGPHPPAQVALGSDFEPTWDPKGADFVLALGTFYCARIDAPVLAEITRDGVALARAYDIRGRDIESLFTQPPVEREEPR